MKNRCKNSNSSSSFLKPLKWLGFCPSGSSNKEIKKNNDAAVPETNFTAVFFLEGRTRNEVTRILVSDLILSLKLLRPRNKKKKKFKGSFSLSLFLENRTGGDNNNYFFSSMPENCKGLHFHTLDSKNKRVMKSKYSAFIG